MNLVARTAVSLLALGILVGCRPIQPSMPPAPPLAPARTPVGSPPPPGAGPGPRIHLTLTTQPSPPVVGLVRFTAKIQTEGARKELPAKVHLSLSMPSMSMKGPQTDMKPAPGGAYIASATLSMAGDWEAKLSARRPGLNRETTFRLPVAKKK